MSTVLWLTRSRQVFDPDRVFLLTSAISDRYRRNIQIILWRFADAFPVPRSMTLGEPCYHRTGRTNAGFFLTRLRQIMVMLNRCTLKRILTIFQQTLSTRGCRIIPSARASGETIGVGVASASLMSDPEGEFFNKIKPATLLASGLRSLPQP